MNETPDPLAGRCVALPESRRLDVLAEMLEKRGARVWRCPLLAILDTPDAPAVRDWLERAIDRPFDGLILLTGEGLRRLVGFAERFGLREDFVAALGRTPVWVRGPKPAQALAELGLKPAASAPAPTTEGVIRLLEAQPLEGRRIGVQCYGDDPNAPLMAYLRRRGAEPDPVFPYIYAPQADEEKVVALIDALAAGTIDAIAFTSSPQWRRLKQVAAASGREAALREGLQRCCVAAVGPIAAQALRDDGVRVDIVPDESYFMKPMVNALAGYFAAPR